MAKTQSNKGGASGKSSAPAANKGPAKAGEGNENTGASPAAGQGAGENPGAAPGAPPDTPPEIKGAGKGKEKVAALSIRSKNHGFRRCGRSWSSEETIVAASDFTDEQIALLKAEPMLIVVDTTI